jgi:hypothetical protein
MASCIGHALATSDIGAAVALSSSELLLVRSPHLHLEHQDHGGHKAIVRMLEKQLERWHGLVVDQDLKASLAAATASLTCSLLASLITTSSWPVTGFKTVSSIPVPSTTRR